MDIDRKEERGKLTLKIAGRLDTTTAPLLEETLNALEGITALELDFEKVEYLSSAGLRVLLGAFKKMKKQGTMVIRHVREAVMEVFAITGFSEILKIEE